MAEGIKEAFVKVGLQGGEGDVPILGGVQVVGGQAIAQDVSRCGDFFAEGYGELVYCFGERDPALPGFLASFPCEKKPDSIGHGTLGTGHVGE